MPKTSTSKKPIIIGCIIAGVAIIAAIVTVAIFFLINQSRTPISTSWGETYYTYLGQLRKNQQQQDPDDTTEYTVSFHDIPTADEPLMFISHESAESGTVTQPYIIDHRCEADICVFPFSNEDITLLYDIEQEVYSYYVLPDLSTIDEYVFFNMVNLNDFIPRFIGNPDFNYETDLYDFTEVTPEQFHARFIETDDTNNPSFTYNNTTTDEELRNSVATTVDNFKTEDEIIAYVSQDIINKINKMLENAETSQEDEETIPDTPATNDANGFTLSGQTYPYGKYQMYGPDGSTQPDTYMILNPDGTGYEMINGEQVAITFRLGQFNMTQSIEENWMPALIVTNTQYNSDHGYVAGTGCGEYCLADTGLGYYRYAGN